MPVRFGVTLTPDPSPAAWREKVRALEDSPTDVLVVNDHLTGLRYAPMVALAAAAGHSTRLRLGTVVLANDYRHPAILAKEAATLDLLSGGRLELGIGAGWMRSDYDQAGLAFEPPRVRLDRLREAVDVLRGAWSDKPFSYRGNHYRTDGLDLDPRPVQRPHPPLLLGGGGRGMLRFAAREADIVNITNRTAADGRGIDPADVGLAPLLAKLALVRQAAAERPVPPEVSVGIRATAVGGAMGRVHPAVAAQVDALRGTPFLLEGSINEVADQLLYWHLEHGISYFILGSDSDANPMFPVMERTRAQLRLRHDGRRAALIATLLRITTSANPSKRLLRYVMTVAPAGHHRPASRLTGEGAAPVASTDFATTGVPVDLAHTLTLGDLAREHHRSRPEVAAIVDGATRLTYAQVDTRATQVAAGLAAAGVRAGDRVLWLGQTSFHVLELLIGCAKAGAILCPANWRQSAEELRFVLDDLQPKLVIWEQVLDTATDLRASEARIRWLRTDGPEYDEWLTAQPATDDERYVDPDSAVLALYTAAFSGRPNAALLSHRALAAHGVALGWIRQIEPGFTYLNSGPLFHVGTMMFCLATFQLGGTNVFMPAFDPVEACRLIEAERCTSAFLYGPMADQLAEANADTKFDLSSLQVSPGSAAWNAMVSLDESPWGQALGGYGQTEVAGMLTFSGLGLGGIGSHGRPMPFAQVRIVDPDGLEVPAGETGEIVARGPALFTGYWNRPELNAAKFRGGWHHTGDLGRRERDGTITFVGPKLRMIKSGGENIYPAEVEQALARHAAVEQAAVIGVPDPKWGQAVKAVVVLREPGTASPEELVQHIRQLIAAYKRPREVVFTDALPRKGFLPDYDALDAEYGGGGYPVV